MSPAGTGNTYSLGSVLNEIVDKNIRLFPILFKQFAHIQYAFFDVKQLAGQGGLTIKPKEIPGIESTVTVDGQSVKWLDYSLFDFSSSVTSTNASLSISSGDVTLVIGDTSGFAVNDTVYLTQTGASDEFDGIVKSITNSTTVVVTVTRVNGSTTIPATISVVAGQILERGYWRRNDNDEILRPSATYNYNEYQSYIQHFSRRLEFTKAELNKVYKYEGEAKMEAQKKFEYNLGILFQEVNKAIYKGKNTASGAGATQKLEMLGLETICTERASRVSLAASTNPLVDLFEQIEISFRSGAILGSEPMMLLCNDRFLTQLSAVDRDKVRFTNKYVDILKMEIPSLQTIYGAVDVIRDPMLNKLYPSYAVAFTVPRSLMKLFVRESQDFEPKRGITKADQSVRIYPVIHNLREKSLYDMEFELGLIAGGISSADCPYRMITHFSAVAAA